MSCAGGCGSEPGPEAFLICLAASLGSLFNGSVALAIQKVIFCQIFLFHFCFRLQRGIKLLQAFFLPIKVLAKVFDEMPFFDATAHFHCYLKNRGLSLAASRKTWKLYKIQGVRMIGLFSIK